MKKYLKIIIFIFILFISMLCTKSEAGSENARMYLDYPTYLLEVSDTITVRGWALSDEEIQIKIYINNTYIKTIERNERRQDVLDAIKGYGGEEKNPLAGFKTTIDISNYKTGTYTLKVEIINKNTSKKLESVERQFKITKPKANIYIDTPLNNLNITENSVKLRGWAMSNTQIELKVYIDNNYIQSIERTERRQDVIDAISGYGTGVENPLAGYNEQIDISNIKDGIHIVKVEAVHKNTREVLTNKENKFIKDSARMYLDYPTYMQETSESVTVRGWALSCEDIDIKVYLNNVYVKSIERTEKRQDVFNAIEGYGGEPINILAGFKEKIDISNYKSGINTVKVEIINKRTYERLETVERQFKIIKPKANLYIDTPKSNININEDNLALRGWAMSSSDIELKVYIDNKYIKDIVRTEKRQDVIDAINGYGTEIENPLPGYNEKIDISNINDGAHIIKVEAVHAKSKEILIYKETKFTKNAINIGIDVSTYQGTIYWNAVKNSGVDFAMIRAGIRGYGVSSDGTNGKIVQDARFKTNIQGAISNGIDVGVYFFSQAINEKEAIEEANFVLNLVKNYKITYPIAIDTELSSHPSGQGRADKLTKEERTKVVDAFCRTIQNAGYKPIIYANKWWLNDNLNMSKLSNYPVWLAHYTGATQSNPLEKPSDYKGEYIMWQFTDKGKINGINTYVDMNVKY